MGTRARVSTRTASAPAGAYATHRSIHGAGSTS